MTSSNDILAKVRQALDEFDDRSLDVSVRRTIRIASLIGDSQTAVRYKLELTGVGGSPKANAADTRKLMTDPESWGTGTSDAEIAVEAYMADRRMEPKDPASLVLMKSISEMILWTAGDLAGEPSDWPGEQLRMHKKQEILTRISVMMFTQLCAWERQFGYASINQSIFDQHQKQVDGMLATGVPDVLEQFTAVYKRLNEAASGTPEAPALEELSQAVTSCRRILKATVDHVFPPESGTMIVVDSAGREMALNDQNYKLRLGEFIKRSTASDTHNKMIKALVTGLYDRFKHVDSMTSHGVHASLALDIANLCALNTYILAGEVLRIHAEVQSLAEPEPTTESLLTSP